MPSLRAFSAALHWFLENFWKARGLAEKDIYSLFVMAMRAYQPRLLSLMALLSVAAGINVTLPDGTLLMGDEQGGFLGVPYATSQRWEASVPAQIESPFDATSYGHACPQMVTPAVKLPPDVHFSEDCLNLNVYVPPDCGADVPVLVWIHGGAFMVGAGLEYPGYTMAHKHDIIVVTFNYRLGSLGFLSMAEMTSPFTGALGLQDQRMALSWVNKNIRAFGGDPDAVTIAGQSAGGSSAIYMLLYFSSSWPTFSRAIIESGAATPMSSSQKFNSRKAADADGAKFLQLVSCPDLACAQNLSFDAIVNASMKIVGSGQPVLLEYSFFDTLAARSFHDVPVLIGDTLNELNFMPYSVYQTPVAPIDYAADFTLQMAGLGATDSQISKLLQEFPCAAPLEDCRDTIGMVMSAFMFGCTTRLVAGAFHTAYSYVWSHRPSWLPYPEAYGVFHAAELKFVLDNLPANHTSEEAALATTTSSMWAQFARGDAPWSDPYPALMNFTASPRMGTPGWDAELCEKMIPILKE